MRQNIITRQGVPSDVSIITMKKQARSIITMYSRLGEILFAVVLAAAVFAAVFFGITMENTV